MESNCFSLSWCLHVLVGARVGKLARVKHTCACSGYFPRKIRLEWEKLARVRHTYGGSRYLLGKIRLGWEMLTWDKGTCGGSRCLPGKIGLSGKGLPESQTLVGTQGAYLERYVSVGKTYLRPRHLRGLKVLTWKDRTQRERLARVKCTCESC
jgi:hypothetical protein